VFTAGHTRWFKREHLERTHAFFERLRRQDHRPRALRPIVRTFTPFVAGVGAMTYPRFLVYSVCAALVWVGVIVYAGYFFGNVPIVKQNFSIVVLRDRVPLGAARGASFSCAGAPRAVREPGAVCSRLRCSVPEVHVHDPRRHRGRWQGATTKSYREEYVEEEQRSQRSRGPRSCEHDYRHGTLQGAVDELHRALGGGARQLSQLGRAPRALSLKSLARRRVRFFRAARCAGPRRRWAGRPCWPARTSFSIPSSPAPRRDVEERADAGFASRLGPKA
jgi:hypothetical protein